MGVIATIVPLLPAPALRVPGSPGPRSKFVLCQSLGQPRLVTFEPPRNKPRIHFLLPIFQLPFIS